MDQHVYVIEELKADDVCEWWLISRSTDLLIRNEVVVVYPTADGKWWLISASTDLLIRNEVVVVYPIADKFLMSLCH